MAALHSRKGNWATIESELKKIHKGTDELDLCSSQLKIRKLLHIDDSIAGVLLNYKETVGLSAVSLEGVLPIIREDFGLTGDQLLQLRQLVSQYKNSKELYVKKHFGLDLIVDILNRIKSNRLDYTMALKLLKQSYESGGLSLRNQRPQILHIEEELKDDDTKFEELKQQEITSGLQNQETAERILHQEYLGMSADAAYVSNRLRKRKWP